MELLQNWKLEVGLEHYLLHKVVSRCQHVKSTKRQVTKIDLWSAFRYVNHNSFEKIAEQRGGLIEIDDRTKAITSLSTARLKVNQNNISAIPSIVYFQDQESWFYDPTNPTIQRDKSWTDREIQSKATGRPQLIDVKNTKLEKKVLSFGLKQVKTAHISSGLESTDT